VTIRTTIERAGRSLSTLSARIEQDGALVALALAAFSVPWSAPEISDLPMPDVAPPDPQRRSGKLLFEGAPPFTQHLILQPRIGVIPFQGASEPMDVGAWLGLAEPRPVDALSLAFLSDAMFSPPFIRIDQQATSPTIDLTIHFRAALPTLDAARENERDVDELCFARFRSGRVHEGFFEEDGVIWGADGTLLAQSRQLAILMPLEKR
jgi:acyl-CoA thioesterase